MYLQKLVVLLRRTRVQMDCESALWVFPSPIPSRKIWHIYVGCSSENIFPLFYLARKTKDPNERQSLETIAIT